MTELKNKAGIPIRVGQVWEGVDGQMRDVIAQTKRGNVVCEGEQYAEINATNSDRFHRLISDPVWGAMSGWRIVTEEKKREHAIPKVAEWYSVYKERWQNPVMLDGWIDGIVYRVPIGHEWEQEQPKPIKRLDLTAYTKTATEIGDKLNEVIDRLNELTK